MMTGKYVSHCEGWDNATPLYVGRITWPWLLKSVGYETALNGKMHMMGPKPLNGFDKQLTFDPHSDNMLPVFRWKDKMKEANKPWEDVLEAACVGRIQCCAGTRLPCGMKEHGGVAL